MAAVFSEKKCLPSHNAEELGIAHLRATRGAVRVCNSFVYGVSLVQDVDMVLKSQRMLCFRKTS